MNSGREQFLADAPVFVVGAPRSGTTWVQRILLSHPQICGGQESHFFPAFLYPMAMFDPPPPNERLVNLCVYWKREEFFEEIRNIWRKTMAPVITAKPTATILIEKTPGHAELMDRIVDLLPESRFIHIVRDARAVVASLLAASREPWGKRWASPDAVAASRVWRSHVSKARKVGQSLGAGKYMELKYEELSADAVGPTKKMLAFLGLEADEKWTRESLASHAFEKEKQAGGSPIPVAVKQAGAIGSEPNGFFRRGSTDAWKQELSFWQKRTVWKIAGRVMEECGYQK